MNYQFFFKPYVANLLNKLSVILDAYIRINCLDYSSDNLLVDFHAGNLHTGAKLMFWKSLNLLQNIQVNCSLEAFGLHTVKMETDNPTNAAEFWTRQAV
jgi:hypothetical protein